MHTLDNQPVLIGDSVFAVGYGVGTVVELLSEGRFRVRLALTPQTMTYDREGFLPKARSRSLYWKDPAIVPPSKDDSFWNALRPAVAALVASLRATQ